MPWKSLPCILFVLFVLARVTSTFQSKLSFSITFIGQDYEVLKSLRRLLAIGLEVSVSGDPSPDAATYCPNRDLHG